MLNERGHIKQHPPDGCQVHGVSCLFHIGRTPAQRPVLIEARDGTQTTWHPSSNFEEPGADGVALGHQELFGKEPAVHIRFRVEEQVAVLDDGGEAADATTHGHPVGVLIELADGMAEALDVPEQEVINVDQHMRAPALSIHAPAGGEEGRELSEIIPDHSEVTPEIQAAQLELGEQIQTHLASFAETLRDEREQTIWTARLVAETPVSLAKLGEDFGVSKERIRQIEARIRKRLKAHLHKTMGEELDFEFTMPGSKDGA